MTTQRAYTCVKCGNAQFETDEIRATGKYSRFFDMQNKKFIAVCCTSCGYTEMYRSASKGLTNILDLFTSYRAAPGALGRRCSKHARVSRSLT